MGIGFDIYRVFKGRFHFKKWIVSVTDFLYWLGAVVVTFWLLLKANDGELRMIVFLAIALGLWVYFKKWSSTTVKIVLLLIKTTSSILNFLVKLFHWTVIQPIHLLIRTCILIWNLLLTIVIRIGWGLWALFKPILHLLAWLVSPITGPILRWTTPYYEKGKKGWRKVLRLYQKFKQWLHR